MSDGSLKILIIARYADRRGGADVYTEGLAIQMAQRGHEVTVLCHAASQSVHDVCRVIEVSDPNFGQRRAVWRLAPLLYQRHWRQTLAHESLAQPDVMIGSLPLSSRDLQNRFPKTPLVYLPHSRIAPIEATDIESRSRVQRNVAKRLYSRSERWSLVHASTTVRFTAGNERELRAYYDLPVEAKFDIVPAPVAEPTALPRDVVGNPLRLVSVCRLVESKNLAWLLKTLAQLPSSDWQWSIAGDGPQCDQLQAQAQQLGVASQVSFLGFCQDVTNVYRSADLHLFPSRRESLGLVILEAMACGVPTLAFQPDGINFQTASDEVIDHAVDGWLAPDEDGFRRRLAHYLATPTDLLPLGDAGRQKVLAEHRWEVVADHWERILVQLTDSSSSRKLKVAHA